MRRDPLNGTEVVESKGYRRQNQIYSSLALSGDPGMMGRHKPALALN